MLRLKGLWRQLWKSVEHCSEVDILIRRPYHSASILGPRSGAIGMISLTSQ